MTEARDIRVAGIVQGVGFRPFVYRLAERYQLTGWVLNAIEGVFIHAEGEELSLDRFVIEISENAPSAAQVRQIDIDDAQVEGFEDFEIRYSDDAAADATTLVSPDIATCDDCVRELFDLDDRRYHYPFINCTNCGPRFTIIDHLPYDRASTSMAGFSMCEACATEYADPADRRFHAQPIACFACGPQLCFAVLPNAADLVDAASASNPINWQWGSTLEETDALIERTVQMLRDGNIVAVKGLGGFHLVCDAANPDALAALRARKRRWGKAFAVMVRDVAASHEHCLVSVEEEALLASPARPIVLLRKKADASLALGLADHLPELGVMLPATPLQHLLVRAFDGMLVMTSGNVHDEPIQIDDEQACVALVGIADAVLGNNRPIRSRYDDSVVRVLDLGDGETMVQVIRRARGFAPLPLLLQGEEDGEKASHPELHPCHLLAVGPQQKNTFCLTRGSEAFVSQHIGDMDTPSTQDAWLQAKTTYESLLEITPACIACDKHPEYLTTKWAHAQDLPVVEVQHHHAHIASVLGEHKLEGPVCGFAFDGTGYGEDGAIWGGEVLLANQQAFERFANFAYFPLPGGEAAIRNPLRCAYGVLWDCDLLDHPAAQSALEALGEQADAYEQMIEQDINCPYTSSVGRLFDAASALLGICTQPTYEGEGAVLFEAVLTNSFKAAAAVSPGTQSGAVSAGSPTQVGFALESDTISGTSETLADFGPSYGSSDELPLSYSIDIVKNTATATSTAQDTSVVVLDPAPAFQALLDDMQAGVPVAAIVQRFHDAIVQAIVQVAQLVHAAYGIETVVLSGGVFMNRYLVEHVVPALAGEGFTVALNRDLPPNDGCIAYGQAVVASRNGHAPSR